MSVSLPPETGFLLTLLSAGPWSQQALPGPPFDWDRFLDLAHWHGVTALVWPRLRPLPDLPEPVRQSLAARSLYVAARHQVLARELLAICDHLDHGGVRALTLKGPALAGRLYADAPVRESSDLDILVEAGAFQASRVALSELGFVPWQALEPWQLQWALRQGGEIPFTRPDGVAIDLHVRFGPLWFPGPRALDDLWQRAAAVGIANGRVAALGDEDLLLHTLLHGAKSLWNGLKWLCDLDRLLRRPGVDWASVEQRAGEWNARRMLLWGLSLAHESLQSPVPEPLLTRARADRAIERLTHRTVPCWSHPTAAPGAIEASRLRLLLEERWARRLGAAAELLCKPTLADWQWRPLPRRLNWAHSLLRPARLLWKHTLGSHGATVQTRACVAPEIGRTSVVVQSGAFQTVRVEGALVLIDLRLERGFVVDAAAEAAWERLAQPTVVNDFETQEEREFVRCLAQAGAVRVL